MADLLQALGSVPTITGVGDIYSALQSGAVEGAMAPFTAMQVLALGLLIALPWLAGG
ncbi:MAG: hypothetical protein ABJH07_15845 [Sedimentitalea sp.]|uniref:hypothetical protein n=1 Tax=Sedimentitalea sp. TaxID=2048915 RepID=UPI003266DF0F